jgi:hypothetical protein
MRLFVVAAAASVKHLKDHVLLRHLFLGLEKFNVWINEALDVAIALCFLVSIPIIEAHAHSMIIPRDRSSHHNFLTLIVDYLLKFALGWFRFFLLGPTLSRPWSLLSELKVSTESLLQKHFSRVLKSFLLCRKRRTLPKIRTTFFSFILYLCIRSSDRCSSFLLRLVDFLRPLFFVSL